MAKSSRSSARISTGGKAPRAVKPSPIVTAVYDPSTSDSALVDSDVSPPSKLVMFVRRRKQEALLTCYQVTRCAYIRCLTDGQATTRASRDSPWHQIVSGQQNTMVSSFLIGGNSRRLNTARIPPQVEEQAVQKRSRRDLDAGISDEESANEVGFQGAATSLLSPSDDKPNKKRSIEDKGSVKKIPNTVLFTDDEDGPITKDQQQDVGSDDIKDACELEQWEHIDVDEIEDGIRTRKGKQCYVSPSAVSSSSDVAVDAMEVQSQLYDVARKHLLQDMAATNPGDGTKCLYGETTFIRDGDDLSDDLYEPLPSTPVKKRAAGSVVQELEPSIFRTPDRKPKDVNKKLQTRSPLQVKEHHVYMEDLEPRGRRHIGQCEVSDDDNKSAIIRYENLPPLEGGRRFLSWSALQGPGNCVPDAWHEQVPGMSMSQFRQTIEFVQHAHIFNPSRIAPDAIGRNPVSGNAILTVAGHPNTPAIFVTTVMITSSNIRLTKDVFGEQRRVCTGIAHNFEFQRMEAMLLAALGEQSVNAQIAQDSITFSTSRTMSGSGSSPAKNPSRMFKQPAGSSSGGSVFAHPRPSLQGIQTVPLLDARRTRFNMGDNLTRLDTILPSFLQEVPEGSCTWIGYTVNKYSTAKGANINFNLMWAVILGTPD
ncbi:hypothetical protein FIBSPDRAFT_963436 [Athelia psychrophila]|uniref:Uncharacterized protein n=1 Tax=Athelia psychrophila TaxID=1759441 RepID=A0A165YYI9_9AGAM|nr:hypothetical protein FIBSPDRAFT_963436 [Fibularhizoctonia sp. CBS 109695]